MKKIVFFIVTLMGSLGSGWAQATEAAGHEHTMVFTKPHAFAANLIIWISIGVVLFTLYITLKYIFFPGEKDPNHIKNIVKDEYFE